MNRKTCRTVKKSSNLLRVHVSQESKSHRSHEMDCRERRPRRGGPTGSSDAPCHLRGRPGKLLAMASNLIAMASHLIAMASNVIAMARVSLQPNSDGRPPNRDGLQPTAMASNSDGLQ